MDHNLSFLYWLLVFLHNTEMHVTHWLYIMIHTDKIIIHLHIQVGTGPWPFHIEVRYEQHL